MRRSRTGERPAGGEDHKVPIFRWETLVPVSEPLVLAQPIKLAERVDGVVIVVVLGI